MPVFLMRLGVTVLAAQLFLLTPTLGLGQPAEAGAAGGGDTDGSIPSQPPPSPESGSSGAFSSSEPLAGAGQGMLSVRPQSLMAQRLHESSYPNEAEFRCLLATTCDFGLSRGFVVGGDLGAMLGTPIIGPLLTPGRWVVLDGYAGFQFLRAADENVFFNAAVGWRLIQHKDSDDRSASASGLTFKVAYGQRFSDIYSQGVVANGFYSTNSVDNVGEDFRLQATSAKRFVDRFYTFSQSFPRFRLGFPADVEFINWKNSHIDLPNHLRGYGRIEPFYIQNEFKESFPVINEYSLVEQNVGLRLAYLMSYVSPQERFGRLGLLGGIGVDVQTSDQSISYGSEAPGYKVALPKRPTVAPYWELGGSIQF